MNPDSENSLGGFHVDNGGVEIIEIDESQMHEGISDPAIREAREAKRRKIDQEYMEKLKKYRPEEYERILEIRRQRGIK